MKQATIILLALAAAAYIAGMVFLYKAGCCAIDIKYTDSIPEARINAGECQFRILIGSSLTSLAVILLGGATAF